MDLSINKIQELYLLHRFSSQNHVSPVVGCMFVSKKVGLKLKKSCLTVKSF